MTLEQQRDLLVDDLSELVRIVIHLRIHTPPSLVDENPFLAGLERQMEEKNAQLNALNAQIDARNARLNSFSYRFRATSRALLVVVWIVAAAMLLTTFVVAPFLGPGYQLAAGIAALLSTVWAIWASIPPKI